MATDSKEGVNDAKPDGMADEPRKPLCRGTLDESNEQKIVGTHVAEAASLPQKCGVLDRCTSKEANSRECRETEIGLSDCGIKASAAELTSDNADTSSRTLDYTNRKVKVHNCLKFLSPRVVEKMTKKWLVWVSINDGMGSYGS